MRVPVVIISVLICISVVSCFLIRRSDGVYQISGFGRSYAGKTNINGYTINSKSIVTSGLCWQETTLSKENPDTNRTQSSSCTVGKDAGEPPQGKSNAVKEALHTHNEPFPVKFQSSKDWQPVVASEINRALSNVHQKTQLVKGRSFENMLESIKPTLHILSSKKSPNRVPQSYSPAQSASSPKTKIENARHVSPEMSSSTFPAYSDYDAEDCECALDKCEPEHCTYDTIDYEY